MSAKVKPNHFQQNWQLTAPKYAPLAIICFGVLVRLSQYLANRSLWYDEAALALNIVNRSYLDLVKALDYNQAAPPLFLWIEKFNIQLLGNNEYALRFFPFICGIVSIFCFYKLAKYFTSGWVIVCAMILFSCLSQPVYFATEAKQYSSDLAIALAFSLWLFHLRHKPLRWQQKIGLASLGAIAIWISHPIIFTLAGFELAYLALAKASERKSLILNRLPVYLVWLTSFALLYFLTISATLGNETLVNSWGKRYPNSIFDIIWLLDSLGRFFHKPLGFLGKVDGLAILPFLIGCIYYWRKQRGYFLVLAAPTVITLVASYLEKYPFRERLILFLVPFFILMIAEGIVVLLTKPKRRSLRIFGGAIALIVLLTPCVNAAQWIIQPQQIAEIRPVTQYLQANRQPNDLIYVYTKCQFQFRYYADRIGMDRADYQIGMASIPKRSHFSEEQVIPFRQEIAPLQGNQRVWLIVCHSKEQEEPNLLSQFETKGAPQEVFQTFRASAKLYDLR